MARTINKINIALSGENTPALAAIKDRALYIGLTHDRYVRFARWVQADLDRRFPWYRHPLYQWGQRKISEVEKVSDILKLVESTSESRIAEEVKAMLAACDQAVAECERLRAENEALRSLLREATPEGIVRLHHDLDSRIRDALRGEVEK